MHIFAFQCSFLPFLFPFLAQFPSIFGQYAPGGNGYYQQQANYGPAGGAYMQQQQPSTPDIIDNEAIEAPQIRCTDHGVEFSVNTRNPFRGNVYVQGQFGLAECRREFYNNDAPHAAIAIALNDCGMIREKRPHGMTYSLVIITNFHPRFVTKVDRAYQIQCSYQHAERPVGVDLDVGSVPTVPVASDAILVPDCEYSMRLGDVNGPPAPGTVKVGDLIYHRWECQDSPVYGMLVKNCRVFDGGNDNYTLIDERGCPTSTGVIQSAPVYSETLNMAYAPIFAFHFPDRTQVNFRCQIQSCNKMDNECIGLTPPNCPQQNYGGGTYGGAYGGQSQQPPPQQYGPTYGPPSSGIYPASSRGTLPPPPSAQTYIGAGFGPQSWPQNALPLGSVLQGNPSQVLQGIGRPPQTMWTPRRRMERKEGQTIEHEILLATQQMRRHANGSWPPSLVVLNRTTTQHLGGDFSRRQAAAASPTLARRFFRPLAPEAMGQQEDLRRQRRAEEKTQDVVASSTVINDGLQGLDWSYENGKERVRPRLIKPNESGQQRTASKFANTYCLDRTILIGILASLGLLSALVFTMFCYMLWDYCMNRHRCRKGLISWRSSSANRNGGFCGIVSNLRNKNLIKRSAANRQQFSRVANLPAAPAVSIVPMPGGVDSLGPNVPHQNVGQGARQMLAGILNAGLAAGDEQQSKRIPPPVPPKGGANRTFN